MIIKAGTILINKKDKTIGLVKRKKHSDISFPKGHLEGNESLKECAIRETIEETGRDCKIIIDEPVFINKYESKEGNVEVYFFLAKDLGEIKKETDEELIWVDINRVEETLTHKELKELFIKNYYVIIENM